jgi:hypothetical protein
MRPASIADRSALLRATVAVWLARAEGRPPDANRIDALLRDVADNGHSVLEQLRTWLATQPGIPAPTGSALARALAQALAERAARDVEREAARAGHAEAFIALRPWLHHELPALERAALAVRLDLPPRALDTALRRLRGRYRQRIEAGLALCSPSAQGRADLRRQLHAALVDLEASR